MEFTFVWFWTVTLLVGCTVLYASYVAVILHKLRNKAYNTLVLVLVIMYIMTPLKMKPVTDTVNRLQNISIEQSKTLPPLKSDNSFLESTAMTGIQDKDLK